MDDILKWITAKRDSRCAQCQSPINVGDRAYWSKQQQKVWCKKCAPAPDEKEGVKEQEKSSRQTTMMLHKCDLCAVGVPAAELTMAYTVKHECYRICSFCRRVITCQAWAKMAGLWVVAKKPENANPEANE